MERDNLVIRLIDADFKQTVDWSEGRTNPLAKYTKMMENGDKLIVEFRRVKVDGEFRYDCFSYNPDEAWDEALVRHYGAERSPANVDGRLVNEFGSTAEQVVAFLKSKGGFEKQAIDEVHQSKLRFKANGWEFKIDVGVEYGPSIWNDKTGTCGMGDHGRLDFLIDVDGHPRFDGLRYFFFPGNGGEVIQWMKNGEHFDNDTEPVSKAIRHRVMVMVVNDLCTELRLKTH